MNEDGYTNFDRERQRRMELNGKFSALRSLVPNPTKADRVSILRDAIEYIEELQGSARELKRELEDSKIIESSDGTKSTCQLCNEYGHLASNCDLRFDANFNNPNAISAIGSQGNNSAYVASPETVNNPELVADSGTTNHVRTRLQGS